MGSRPAKLLIAVLLCAACTDSDKVSWVIVSNPGGSFPGVQGGLLVTWRYSDKNVSFVMVLSATDADRRGGLRVVETGGPRGDDPTARREFLAGLDSDAVVVLEYDRAEIVSPALPGGSVALTGAAVLETRTDPATLVRVLAATGERFHVAAAGNLVIREDRSGIAVHLPSAPARTFGPGSGIEVGGDGYVVVEPTGRRTVFRPPAGIPVGSQAVYDASHGSYRFFSDRGEFVAELPERGFARFDGGAGLVLDGRFAAGTVDTLPGEFRALLTRRNHHLVVVRSR